MFVDNHKHLHTLVSGVQLLSAGDLIHDIKQPLLRAIIMSASKPQIGPRTSIHGFHTFHDVFSRGETWIWNQRHGSIIHSYYKNTASKDTYQITISEGYAFSTSQFTNTDTRTHTDVSRAKIYLAHILITGVVIE